MQACASGIQQWHMRLLRPIIALASQTALTRIAIDNEPSIAYSMHRDVVPQPLSYEGLWGMTLEFAGAIKARRPSLKTHCLVHWGWCGEWV